jgi:two-component system chemotaxis response regulator CheB
LVKRLPHDLDAAVFIVLHMAPGTHSFLHEILQRETSLIVKQATDSEPFALGEIRVSRPDYHLVLDENLSRLTRGPRENRIRPAIDTLFRSAAYTQGSRAIGVLLSGLLDDGSAGLWWIKNRGGATIVQHPKDAEWPDMPANAIAQAQCDHVVPISEMAAILAKLSRKSVLPMSKPAPHQLELEVRVAKGGNGFAAGIMDLGDISPYTCPECHGVLVQLKEGAPLHFRCHTGHAYSLSALLSHVTEYIEDTLWDSIRAIEESAMMLHQMARRARESELDEALAERCEEKAKDTLKRANTLRSVARENQTLSHDNIEATNRGSR